MSTKVGIVGYKMGNIASLRNAFLSINVDVFVAEAPQQLREATHIVLPGVGAFPKGMEQLRSLGFENELRQLVLDGGRPLLGICLGMQLLAIIGEEHRVTEGLGFIPGRVTLFQGEGLRIPHVGWNDTISLRDNVLLGPAGTTGCFYYVHSYHLVPDEPVDVSMICTYGQTFTAAVECGNIYGVQFHPEKSHVDGLQILKRFVEAPLAKTSPDTVSVSTKRIHRPEPGVPGI